MLHAVHKIVDAIATFKGQRVGYVRVSTIDQNEARQLDGIPLDRTFVDKASGKDVDRPQFKEMLAFVRDGDVVICHSMDRLARNAAHLQSTVEHLTRKGVQVQFLKEGLTFTGDDLPVAMLMLSIIGAVARFERELILERQKKGIALAKKAGVYKGRKHVLTAAQASELRKRLKAGERKVDLAHEYGIDRTTVYRYLSREKAKRVQRSRADACVGRDGGKGSCVVDGETAG